MVLSKELFNWNNKLFYVYKRIKKNEVKEEYIQQIKELWHCDMVVRQTRGDENILLFLREITEAEVVL